jgi:hypothetical protein
MAERRCHQQSFQSRFSGAPPAKLTRLSRFAIPSLANPQNYFSVLAAVHSDAVAPFSTARWTGIPSHRRPRFDLAPLAAPLGQECAEHADR